MKQTLQRADQALVERGLVESLAKAQALLLAGKVFSGEKRIDKAGQKIRAGEPLQVRGEKHPWVSRGGLKLAHARPYFNLDVSGMTALDLGASTGGFTDVLLQNGAARVYAVDVGHGQLAWSLRTDDRVVVMERTNARTLTREQIAEPIDIIVCDASFIGLETVLPASMSLISPGGYLIALIKPQFEVKKEQVGAKGVVRDPDLHAQVCGHIRDWLSALPGWNVLGIVESPITGPEGNKEFLIAAQYEA